MNSGNKVDVSSGSDSGNLNGTPFFRVHADGNPVESTSLLLPAATIAFGFDFASQGDGTQLIFAEQAAINLRDDLRLTSGFVGFITDRPIGRIDFVDRFISFNDTQLDNFSTVASIPGDYNADGFVDAADYTVWRDSLNVSAPEPFGGADGSGDGEVTTADYDVWKGNFGRGPSSAASNSLAIPEPASLFMLCLGGLASLGRLGARGSRISR